MDQLEGLDAMFLSVETPAMHMHVCGLLLLDTSTGKEGYSFDRIRALLAERLPRVALARRRVAPAPLGLGRPAWIDDGSIDIDRHLRRIVLQDDDRELELRSTVDRLAGEQLPRDRPLWEMSVIEGLAGDRVAIFTKIHHSIIDGVSATGLIAGLFDLKAEATMAEGGKERRSQTQAPRPLEVLGRNLVRRAMLPLDLARLVPVTVAQLAPTLWRLRATRELSGAPKATPFTAPRTPFNGSLSPRRAVVWVDVPLADVKQIKNAAGATVNDVITAIVGGALRHYLEDHDELPEHTLIAAVPVSIHDSGVGKGTTRVSIMFSNLATDEKDPLARLRKVASGNIRAKSINGMFSADLLMQWVEHIWLDALSWSTRLYSALHLADRHPAIHNLILSNVPGPPIALYFAGARVVGLYPLGPLMEGAGLNITVLSQDDRVGFGIITCPDLVPDVHQLAWAVPEALRDLAAATA